MYEYITDVYNREMRTLHEAGTRTQSMAFVERKMLGKAILGVGKGWN